MTISGFLSFVFFVSLWESIFYSKGSVVIGFLEGESTFSQNATLC